ncbi:LAFA_0B03246g1_1 [Lachancea sp. 'fantastica']|nr:LAFA_0B03246g1_1 [Lachancea sp. 'fantastica']
MSAKASILEDIVSTEASDSEVGVVRSDEEESFMQLDGDAFRLDIPSGSQKNGKSLFVNEDSVSGDLEELPGLIPSTSNRESKHEPADLWDFKPLVQQEFERRLPQNYELRGWKKPSRRLVLSLQGILESNVGIALDKCFAKYETDCERIFLDRSVRSVHREKEIMLVELVEQIKQRISQARFPTRCSDRDLDIEYIYAKRQYIQSQFSLESARVEALQHQVQREQTRLDELKTLRSKTTERNARKFKQLTDQLSKNLHPALSKAMINSFGLLRDKHANTERYQYDVDDLNLQLHDQKPPVSPPKLEESLTSVHSYYEALQGFEDIQTGAFKNAEGKP